MRSVKRGGRNCENPLAGSLVHTIGTDRARALATRLRVGIWTVRMPLLFTTLLAFSTALAAPSARAADKPELVVYAYDTLTAKHGLGPDFKIRFEAKCGCTLKLLPSGDGGQLLSRIQLDQERGKSIAQVAWGLDQNIWPRAQAFADPWDKWRPAGFDRIDQRIRVGQAGAGFLPFDYGAFAFMADTEALKEHGLTPPHSLRELLAPGWKRNLILEDPRTSTPGLAFVLWTSQALGAGFAPFWTALHSQWLTLSPGWDGAYGLFLKKEAPLVWSYTSSQAYHVAHGDLTGRYQALAFEEGQPVQIEGAMVLKSVTDPKLKVLARQFLEFLLSDEAQAAIPEKNWMLPAIASTHLPASFAKVPVAKTLLRVEKPAAESEALLRQWAQAIAAPAH